MGRASGRRRTRIEACRFAGRGRNRGGGGRFRYPALCSTSGSMASDTAPLLALSGLVAMRLATFSLAWLGSWLERRDAELTGTAAILRGAAVGLLPINFMTVNLLAGDPQVTARGWVAGVLTIVYIWVFGRGLQRWCGAVHPSLTRVAGIPLIILNTLVLTGPLAQLFSSAGDADALSMGPRVALGVGFHVRLLAGPTPQICQGYC